MIRLETENKNTIEYYNNSLIVHFVELGMVDTKDRWRLDWLLKSFKGGKLLDLGCGISALPILAAKIKDSEIYAVDFADHFIILMDAVMKITEQKNIHYLVGNVDKIPFEDNFFDYVVLGELLEHCENPQNVIGEVKRVLKDDGLIAISTPNEETKDTHKDLQHIWSISKEDIEQLVKVKQIDVIGKQLLCIGEK